MSQYQCGGPSSQNPYVSVPMWGTFLSEPLSIVGLVGRYPANCLMERMPNLQRIAPLTNIPMRNPCFMGY